MAISMSLLAILVACGVGGMLLAIPILGYFFGMFKKKAVVEVHSSAEKGEMVIPRVAIHSAQSSRAQNGQGPLKASHTTVTEQRQGQN
ncbi:hypothetical protein P153DRAFT_363435, partial [Dothidotthia symphoricarpi CBS 119687]